MKKDCTTCSITDADVCRTCVVQSVSWGDPTLWQPKKLIKKNKEKHWYYIDGYVEKTNTKLTKKEAIKRHGKYNIFPNLERAENFRLAGILAG